MKLLWLIFFLWSCQTTTAPRKVSEVYYACELEGELLNCRTLEYTPCGLTLRNCVDNVARYCVFNVYCYEIPFYFNDLKFLKPLPPPDEET